MDADTLFFFDGRPEELALYEALLRRAETLGPVTERVCKTQISLRCRRVFACVSFLPVLPRARRPAHFIVVSLGLPEEIVSPRIAARVPIRPGRWTHHIVIGDEAEMDGTFMDWLREAYLLADR